MKIYALFFTQGLFLRFAQANDYEFFQRDRVENKTVPNMTEHEHVINILTSKNYHTRQLRDLDQASVSWHKPNYHQIILLRQTLDANSKYKSIKNIEVRRIAFQVIDDNFYAIYRLIYKEYQKIYVKILLWRSTDTYNNRGLPEIVEVTKKDPLTKIIN
ncbi:hypothetical protein HZS_319 [Henneguya salminicola]|nr:hypothetical protein HZS_319 [Henneguya salminicola]